MTEENKKRKTRENEKKKQVLRLEHGSETFCPFGNYDRPTDGPTSQATDKPGQREVSLPIITYRGKRQRYIRIYKIYLIRYLSRHFWLATFFLALFGHSLNSKWPMWLAVNSIFTLTGTFYVFFNYFDDHDVFNIEMIRLYFNNK